MNCCGLRDLVWFALMPGNWVEIESSGPGAM